VTDEEINRIREGLTRRLAIRPHPNVQIGMRVRIRKGVFAGVEGTVNELRTQCRVIIAFAAVHQSFSLEVAADDLEVLNSPGAKHLDGYQILAYSD
jgi:transcription antitermination factor NusG